MTQRAFSLILLIVLLLTGPAHAAKKKSPSSFNFLRLKSSNGVKAPLVIEPGVLTSSSEDGSIEFDGNDLYITKSGVKTVLGGEGSKGEKGDKGDTGERGPRGLAGPSGPSGPAGSFSGGDAVVSGILSFSTGRLQGAFLNGTSLFSTNSIAKFNGSILIPASAANGKVLTSNGGGLASWKTLPTSTPGGSSGQVQINNSGSFAGNGSLFWDFANKRLGIGTTSPDANLQVNASSSSTKGLIVKAAASQTANLTEWQDSAGTVKLAISPSGELQFNASTPGTALIARETSTGVAWALTPNSYDVYANTTVFSNNTGATRGKIYAGAGQFANVSASDIGLTIKAAASQTANLTEWQNSAGTVLTKVGSDGSVTVGPNAGGYLSVGNASGSIWTMYVYDYTVRMSGSTKLAWTSHADYANQPIDTTLSGSPSGGLTLSSQNASAKLLTVKGAASQSGNLTEWQNSAGTTLTAINSNGQLQIPFNQTGGIKIGSGTGSILAYAAAGSIPAEFRIFRASDNSNNATIYSSGITASYKASLNNLGVTAASDKFIGFNSTTHDGYGSTPTMDTALARNAAGVLEVNSGTAGQYRDLKVRKISMTEAMRIEPQASPPSSPALGDIYVDTSEAVCMYVDAAWTKIAGSGSCS